MEVLITKPFAWGYVDEAKPYSAGARPIPSVIFDYSENAERYRSLIDTFDDRILGNRELLLRVCPKYNMVAAGGDGSENGLKIKFFGVVRVFRQVFLNDKITYLEVNPCNDRRMLSNILNRKNNINRVKEEWVHVFHNNIINKNLGAFTLDIREYLDSRHYNQEKRENDYPKGEPVYIAKAVMPSNYAQWVVPRILWSAGICVAIALMIVSFAIFGMSHNIFLSILGLTGAVLSYLLILKCVSFF